MRKKKDDNIEGPIVRNTSTILLTVGLVFVIVLIAAGIVSGFGDASENSGVSDKSGMVISIIGFILFIIVVYIFIKNLFFDSRMSSSNSSNRRKSGQKGGQGIRRSSSRGSSRGSGRHRR